MKPFSLAKATLTALALTLATTAASADQIINLRSGNGPVGGVDSDITMLVGPANSAFSGPLNFAGAQSGPQALVIVPNSSWLSPSSFSDPSARWISTHTNAGPIEGSSALFAIDFTITDTSIAFASIDFDFSVDNLIGGGSNEGLFINGTALSGSTTGGGFNSVFNHTRNDIAPLLVTGTNTLYVNMTDVGGPSGLIFSATITTTAVPEPGAIAVFGLGLIGLGLARRKARR